MHRGPIDAAALEREIFQIPTSIGYVLSILAPAFRHLRTSPEVEIPHERSSFRHNLRQSSRRDSLIELFGIQIPPQLSIKAHSMPSS